MGDSGQITSRGNWSLGSDCKPLVLSNRCRSSSSFVSAGVLIIVIGTLGWTATTFKSGARLFVVLRGETTITPTTTATITDAIASAVRVLLMKTNTSAALIATIRKLTA